LSEIKRHWSKPRIVYCAALEIPCDANNGGTFFQQTLTDSSTNAATGARYDQSSPIKSISHCEFLLDYRDPTCW
jgi:hypothetical protein